MMLFLDHREEDFNHRKRLLPLIARRSAIHLHDEKILLCLIKSGDGCPRLSEINFQDNATLSS